MSDQESTKDQFDLIREAETDAANYDLDTDAIIARLQQWQKLCQFQVVSADYDTVEIKFDTLPADMDAFVKELYEFCPDLMDQGTGCVAEMIEEMDEVPPQLQKLIEGVDFEDENYGLEILKREIQQQMGVSLWWD